jgi:hypothetical protein
MRPESAAPAARDPLVFEEHHFRGNLRHAGEPDRASNLQPHDAQFQSPALPRGEGRVKGADAQVLLEGDEVPEGRRISLGRNPEPLVPQRRCQLMPSGHWNGMRGIGLQ